VKPTSTQLISVGLFVMGLACFAAGWFRAGPADELRLWLFAAFLGGAVTLFCGLFQPSTKDKK